MSHFTVLVIGEDVEGQLAPYDENLLVEPYRLPMDLDAARDMAHHYFGIDPQEVRSITADLAAKLIPHMHEWNGCEGGYDEDGLFYLSRYNPDSKWDWYTIGGRWKGFFRLKDGALGVLGDPTSHPLEQMVESFIRLTVPAGAVTVGADARAPKPATADQAQKGSIDWEAMAADAAASALSIFHAYEDCFAGRKIPRFADFLARESTAEAARLAYWADPVIAAIRARETKRNEMLSWDQDYHSYFADGTLHSFVHRHVTHYIGTYAVLSHGEWYAPGDMGWWGMSSESDGERETWHTAFFDRFIAPLPDAEWLSLVDCHI